MRLVVGLVRGLHGVHGRVRVEVLTDSPERRFAVKVASGDCYSGAHYAELAGTITVLPGAANSNGPAMPEGSIEQNPEGAPVNGVGMSFGASDRDGVVRRVTIDWGDGSPPSVIDVRPSDYACVDEPSAYPSAAGTYSLDHVYATDGSYTVTATILSTGCDGHNEQSARVTGVVTVEAESA